MYDFSRSDVGAQAAWKGFSSQTLYIASRLILDKSGYEYYPEDIEDLVVKKDGFVIEAVQVKNVSADLTLSSLAATKTSKGGDGFFNRMCSLHVQNPSFYCIKVVYFFSNLLYGKASIFFHIRFRALRLYFNNFSFTVSVSAAWIDIFNVYLILIHFIFL